MTVAIFAVVILLNVAVTAYLFMEIRSYDRELESGVPSPAPDAPSPDVRSEAVVPVEPSPAAVMLLKGVRRFLEGNPDRVVGVDDLDGPVVTVGLDTTGPAGRAAADTLVDLLPPQGVTQIKIRDSQVVLTLGPNRMLSSDWFVLPETGSSEL